MEKKKKDAHLIYGNLVVFFTCSDLHAFEQPFLTLTGHLCHTNLCGILMLEFHQESRATSMYDFIQVFLWRSSFDNAWQLALEAISVLLYVEKVLDHIAHFFSLPGNGCVEVGYNRYQLSLLGHIMLFSELYPFFFSLFANGLIVYT